MMLNQLSAGALERLKDKPIAANAIKFLLRMKPARQVEAAELIVSTGNFTRRFAQALYVATKPGDRLTPRYKHKRMRGLPHEQQAKMQQKLEYLLNDFSDFGATENYGSNVLSLVVASGYVSKLIGNNAIESYLGRNHPEILQEFRTIVAAVSLENSLVERS